MEGIVRQGICVAAGKQVYTPSEAKTMARIMRERWGRRGRGYPCPFGNHYHVTHHPEAIRRIK